VRNRFDLHLGDCLEVMPTLAADSVDSIVSDPPYGLSFMGKGWDHGVPGQSFWTEALRVAKPGAHLLAFGGTRTYHRLACAIEDAGWEIRDCVMWVYGSGFPKSHDVSKAIDKAAGYWRGKSAGVLSDNGAMNGPNYARTPKGDPVTAAAAAAAGWGTALKPAWEPVIVARKPLDGTVAANVLKYGTGGINVDGCRVGTDVVKTCGGKKGGVAYGDWAKAINETHIGRWPANFIHDGSEDVESLAGSAARFFYCAKASKADRDEGLEGFALRSASECCEDREPGSAGLDNPRAGAGRTSGARNIHPTVKPTSLMRYLCRLVTTPNGVILDPFMGSGSTGKGAMLEGFRFIGIEREEEYLEIARARIDAATKSDNAFPLFQEELACV